MPSFAQGFKDLPLQPQFHLCQWFSDSGAQSFPTDVLYIAHVLDIPRRAYKDAEVLIPSANSLLQLPISHIHIIIFLKSHNVEKVGKRCPPTSRPNCFALLWQNILMGRRMMIYWRYINVGQCIAVTNGNKSKIQLILKEIRLPGSADGFRVPFQDHCLNLFLECNHRKETRNTF